LNANLGGNFSEEKVSPRPPSKDFCDVPTGAVTSAVKAQKVSEGVPASEGRLGEALFKEFPISGFDDVWGIESCPREIGEMEAAKKTVELIRRGLAACGK